jgi:hypothetical protein
MLHMKTIKRGWVIESGPECRPVYFCNGWWHGEVSLPRWTLCIGEAHFWTTKDGACAAVEEWALTGLGTHKGIRICEHEICFA